MIFSGNPADRLYFLGQGSDAPEKVKEKNGSLKPCIHGSDADDEDKLFQPDDNRYCWVKAKPTFEGLRQLLHEPEHRVTVGPTHPMPIDASKIIDHVTLAGAPAWFADEIIHLNSGLVTIIGEKGAGKTALAELIAFATSAWKSKNGRFVRPPQYRLLRWARILVLRKLHRRLGALGGPGQTAAAYGEHAVEPQAEHEIRAKHLALGHVGGAVLGRPLVT